MATITAQPISAPPGWTIKRGKFKPIELPSPLVRIRWDRPRTWFWSTANAVHGLALVALAAYLGMLMGAALYYGFLQTYQPITDAWHYLVPSDYWRHLFRDAPEGFFGGLFGRFYGWNYYKSYKVEPDRVDRLLIKHNFATRYDLDPLSGKQFRKALRWVVPAGMIGGITACLLVLVFHYKIITASALLSTAQSLMPWLHIPSNQSFLGAASSFALTGLPVKLVGFLAAHFYAKRVMIGVYQDVQLWIIELLISFGIFGKVLVVKGPLRVLIHPAFAARYKDVAEHAELGANKPSRMMKFWLCFLALVCAALIVGGAYVIFWVARH